MIIKFSIHYNTQERENLYITGTGRQLGDNDIARALPLVRSNSGVWRGEINYSPAKERILTYKYVVKGPKGVYYEAGKPRSIAIGSGTKEVSSFDQWQGNSPEAPFFTAPFSDVYYGGKNTTPHTQTHVNNNECIIRVTVPNISKEDKVCICGNTKELGEWDPDSSLELLRMNNSRWEVNLPTERMEDTNLEFKFGIRRKSGAFIWEDGENRYYPIPKIFKHTTLIIEYSSARFNCEHPRFAGVAVPVFSLRTKGSCGIGDFGDLNTLVEWSAACGMSIIQLLPVNDTSACMDNRDSYPYNCISAMALHPIYADLRQMGVLEDPEKVRFLAEEARELNAAKEVLYKRVLNYKMKYLRALFEQDREDTFAEPGCFSFIRHNKAWLLPYAAFCALRDKYGTADFRKWKEDSVFSQELLGKVTSAKSKLHDSVQFHIFIQYHLHKQLLRAREYAHDNGIALKGDIPIGISRCSVEAWQYPTLFNFGQQAGAPPDAFAKDGQNWGFPTYNWKEMAKDNYQWWKQRFAHMETYFDAYRLDHILGFFRIWEIPIAFRSGLMGHFNPALPLSPEEISNSGLSGVRYDGLFIEDPYRKGHYHPAINGCSCDDFQQLPIWHQDAYRSLYHNYFYERHNDFWYAGAMEKLQQLIASGNMLACGEDLGMLNESVSRCMKHLNILSLELQTMPKQGNDLGNPAGYPYLSVCTTSTHDCPTLRMWLGERYDMKDAQGEPDATPGACLQLLLQNLASPSMFAIFPLQDWLSIDASVRAGYAAAERINDPADAAHVWKYRMHLPLESLLENKGFCNRLKDLARR